MRRVFWKSVYPPEPGHTFICISLHTQLGPALADQIAEYGSKIVVNGAVQGAFSHPDHGFPETLPTNKSCPILNSFGLP